jgi:hypothetical protein
MVKGKFSLSGRRASLIYAFPLKSHSSPLMVGSVKEEAESVGFSTHLDAGSWLSA